MTVKQPPHQQRRCVSCRKREDKSSLLRVVFADGRLTWDRQKRMRGRGAWCHPERECIIRLAQKGLLERGLRIQAVSTEGAAEGGSSAEQRAALVKELLDFVG